MITNDFTDYSYRFNNKEQFKAWLKDHCENCWGSGYGDCEICKQNQAIIEKTYERVGEDK